MSDRICFPYGDDERNLPEFIKDMNEIYAKMSDDLSKEILASRILLCLTEDYSHMKSVILHTKGGKSIHNIITTKNQKPQYIYGAGIRGKRMLKLFPDNTWGGFIDRNKNQINECSLKILNIEEFLKLYTPGTAIFVSNLKESEEIVRNLEEGGIKPDDIYVLNDFDKEGSEKMYFPTECIGESLDREKAFVDIGCFDGHDTLNFMKWNNDYNAKIYAFEPNINNYKICLENLKAYPNIKLLNTALSDREEDISMEGNGETSHIGSNGDIKIHTQSLDNIIKSDIVGYIKMDVEGFEENVIKGAQNIIRDQKPILAISIYHKRFDIWRIPTLLLQYNKNYRFYLRYYGAITGDTVLYAVNQ